MPQRRIPTDLPDLCLVELTPSDARSYFELVARNRDHLTHHGDYTELKHATFDAIVASLSDPADRNAKFGIWLGETLIGRVDLSPRAGQHFVIGYWLGRDFTGKGYASMACSALLQYGYAHLGAKAVYAGVTKGNTASEELLNRLGFVAIDDRETYTLFRHDRGTFPRHT